MEKQQTVSPLKYDLTSHAGPSGPRLLMLAGGYNFSGVIASSSLLDLSSNDNLDCPVSLAPLPEANDQGISVRTQQGNLLVCGGPNMVRNEMQGKNKKAQGSLGATLLLGSYSNPSLKVMANYDVLIDIFRRMYYYAVKKWRNMYTGLRGT